VIAWDRLIFIHDKHCLSHANVENGFVYFKECNKDYIIVTKRRRKIICNVSHQSFCIAKRRFHERSHTANKIRMKSLGLRR